jgi:hypothetical protein
MLRRTNKKKTGVGEIFKKINEPWFSNLHVILCMCMINLFGKQADIHGEESPVLTQFSTVQHAIVIEDFAIFFSPLRQLTV